MRHSKRPIEPGWQCKRSGDCCQQVPQIVMTREEADELKKVASTSLTFYRHLDARFVYLKGQPCPLLGWEGKKAVCTVWAVRPYNCRRFGCFRPNPAEEPYEAEPLDLSRSRLGCANLSDRLTDRQVRREYVKMQRHAQRWANKHGWTPDVLPAQTGSNVTFYGLDRFSH